MNTKDGFVLFIPSLDDTLSDFEKLFSLFSSATLEEKVLLDFSRCQYIRPNLFAYMSSVWRMWWKAGIQLSVLLHTISVPLSGLISQHELFPSFAPHGTPHIHKNKRFTDTKAATIHLRDIVRDIPSISHMEGAFYGAIGEIFTNALDHSFGDGWIYFASHVSQKQNVVKILIANNGGIGIPYHVRRELGQLRDELCLGWALHKGNTTKTSPGGLGLFRLCEMVKRIKGGEIDIYSENGYINYKNGIIAKAIQLTAGCAGTIVNISLPYS